MSSAAIGTKVASPLNPALVWVGGALLLLVAVVLGCSFGAANVSARDVLHTLASVVGLPGSPDPMAEAVLMSVRLPRVVVGALVGAGLAIGGVLLQAMFKNPLADPALLGISGGASLAVATWTVFGFALPGAWGAMASPIMAFIGGLIAVMIVLRLGRTGSRTSVTTLLLAGIAVNAIAAAGVGLLLFMANDAQIRTFTFWSLGSLGGSTWPVAMAATPLILGPVVIALLHRNTLDALLLGDAEAHWLGIDVERVQRILLLATACLVGAAVASAGGVGFIGLVVPHVARLAVGASHRLVLPACLFLGPTLVLLADLASRTLAAPAELPIGVLTTLLGAPLFLTLLQRLRQGQMP